MPIPVVVLGAKVLKDGRPSPSLLRRSLGAVALMRQGVANKIIASGGVGRYQPAEASVIREIVMQHGINEADIILDIQSKTTIETAFHCSQIVARLGYHEAWIVTDPYHMGRALLAFRALGICGRPAPVDQKNIPSSKFKRVKARVREIFACIAGLPGILRLYVMRVWPGLFGRS